jgi:hypothetical protein
LRRRAVRRRQAHAELFSGLAGEPLIEANAANPGLVIGDERTILQFAPEIPRVRVAYDSACIVDRLEVPSNEIAEPQALGSGYLDDAIDRRGKAASVTKSATSSEAIGWR